MITGIVVALLLAVIVFQYMIIKIDKDKRHEAGHDKLTGLCNPEHLMQKMKELPDKKKNRLIIYSDIAEFKLINEIFGIEKGNEILLKQADIIKKHAVDGYLYGRVGEDHFVVIADEATFNEEYLYECRETLQNVLSDSVYNVRVCFGIYRTDNMNESLSFMCDKASFAVASIKDDTHSFIAYYDDTMLEAAIKYKTIVDEFDDAIKAGEFKMYLQPQISAKTRRLTGAEALVRRIKPDGTIISPIDFIPVYEKSGLISRLPVLMSLYLNALKNQTPVLSSYLPYLPVLIKLFHRIIYTISIVLIFLISVPVIISIIIDRIISAIIRSIWIALIARRMTLCRITAARCLFVVTFCFNTLWFTCFTDCTNDVKRQKRTQDFLPHPHIYLALSVFLFML